jgi:putative lipoprotein
MKMVRLTATFALGLSTLALAACASTATPAGQPVTVSGSIAYRERIALPPTAQIEVRLDDVSLADAPARNIARQTFTADGKQVPFAFSLTVDKAELDPRHSYAVAAQITGDDGKLMFITDTRNSVSFDGPSTIDMGTLNLAKTN